MKKSLYIFLIPAYILQWVFTVIQNLAEVVANGFEEICLSLTNFIHKDEAKPTGSEASSTANKAGS